MVAVPLIEAVGNGLTVNAKLPVAAPEQPLNVTVPVNTVSVVLKKVTLPLPEPSNVKEAPPGVKATVEVGVPPVTAIVVESPAQIEAEPVIVAVPDIERDAAARLVVKVILAVVRLVIDTLLRVELQI